MTRGLWDLDTAALEHLAVALTRRGDDLVTEVGLQRDGVEPSRCRAVIGLPAAAAKVAVDAILGERRAHPPPELELVWSGREVGGTLSRDTSQVLPELFRRATRSVLVAGFAFHAADDIFAPLHARARDAGVAVEFFIHVDGAGRDTRMSPTSFLARSWPWRDAMPALYYDARADAGDASSTMHAKCIVVDDREVLITSANFTARAQHANVELGVLVRDVRFAARVAAQWRALVTAGLFCRHATS